jgi:iron-sulfur cluster repair protein YtfE (RIC family)
MRVIRATELIRDDHKRILGLFRQSEAARQRAPEMLDGVIGEMFMELEIHSRVAGEILYPRLMAAFKAVGMGEVGESAKEHIVALREIQQIRKLDPDDERFEERLADVVADMESHMEEEERDVLQPAEKLLSQEDLCELGREMLERRDALLSLPKYRRYQPSIVQDPHGGEQMRRKGGLRKAG